MFLCVLPVGALFNRLVPLTKLDESFTKLPTDGGSFTSLPERVVSCRSSKLFSLFLEQNSVSA